MHMCVVWLSFNIINLRKGQELDDVLQKDELQ